MNMSSTRGWMKTIFMLLISINIIHASNNNDSFWGSNPENPIKITTCDEQSNETELVFSTEKDWNPYAPPFECGTSVVTYQRGAGAGNSVMSVIDNREHNLAPMSPSQAWAGVHPLYTHPDWTYNKMGQIFGTAIDDRYNIYVTTTTCFGRYPIGNLAGAGPGTIFKADATTGAISVFANLPTNVVTSGTITAGLGNICFNPDNKLLYVSDLIDGKIYCLDMAGNIVDTFDPPLSGTAVVGDGFYDPSAAPAFAPLGQRIWGIGYYDGTLYFGVWREDLGHLSSDNNELWSVNLLGTGLFAGSTNVNGDHWENANMERSMSQLSGSPISDIAFSANGDELFLGTRTRKHATNPYAAHSSSVWRLPRASLGSGAMMQYYVGNHGSHTNCAGGIDIGYASVKKGVTPSVCDAMVWSTGDALIYNPPSVYLYGVAGIPYTGNTTSNVANTSVYIDVKNNLSVGNKTQYGDIEIFKCGCKDPFDPPYNSFCDSISINSVASQGDKCCFDLTIDNTALDYFGSVELQTTGGTSISSFMSLGGWLPQSYSATNLIMAHPSGVIPPGSSTFAKICLSEYYAGPQSVLVNYYDIEGHVACTDTIEVVCSDDPKCVNVVEDSISCSQKVGAYDYKFCIKSNDFIGWNVNSIVLNPPAGVTFSPNTFSIPNLMPGMTTCTYTTTITGALPNEDVCFSVTGHSEDILQQQHPLNCCTDTVDLVCITMPDCSPCPAVSASLIYQQQAAGGCCWDIALSNSFDNNYFTAVSTELITPGVAFAAINNTPGSGWFMNDVTPPFSPTHAQFKPFPPFGGFIGATDTLPTICLGGIDNASEIPQEIVVHWWVGDEIVCSDTLVADCPIEPVNTRCAKIVNEKIECGEKAGSYVVTFDVVNNSGHDIQEIELNAGAGFTFTPSTFPAVIAAGATLTGVSTVVTGTGPGPVCFTVTLHEIDASGNNLNCCTENSDICLALPDCGSSCTCGAFDKVQLVISPNNPDENVFFQCGGEPVNVGCPENDDLTFPIQGIFNCNGDCEMNDLNWAIEHNGITTHSGSMTTSGLNFSFDINNLWFQDGGQYNFTLTGKCGEDLCRCTFTMMIPTDCNSNSSDCCKDEEGFNDLANTAFKSLFENQAGCDTLCFSPKFDSCVTYCINWGDQTEEDCTSENEICHIYTDTNASAGGSWYYVCMTATEGTGDSICFTKTICDSIFIKSCEEPVCECGAFDKVQLEISPNNPDKNIFFTCGGEPVKVDCPPTKDEIHPIKGLFNCNGNCEMSDLNWSISHNGTTIQSGAMMTFGLSFQFNIHTSWFEDAGQYNFTLTGKCGDQVCRCRFSIVVPDDCNNDCCQDDAAFYDAAYNAFNNIGIANCQTLCFEVPQDSCMKYCIDWGDGTAVECPTDGKICHDFDIQQETNFGVCLTATSGIGDSVCFETKICKDFIVKPCESECGCGGFTGLSLTFQNQSGIKMKCGGEYDLGCPNKQEKYSFRGWYNCKGNCEPTDLKWSLSLNGNVTHDGTLLTGGTGPAGLAVGMTLLSDWFSQPGVYELTYSGTCNGKQCDCTVKLVVKENCGCSCDTLDADVAQGFIITIPYKLDCILHFTPAALTECDEVQWIIKDNTGVVHTETTAGNAPIDFEFTNGTDYYVQMIVVRTDENGKVCKSVYEYKFTMQCNGLHQVGCIDDAVKNPGFTNGLDGWDIIAGKPYVNRAMGSQDEGFLVLQGNKLVGDGISQPYGPAGFVIPEGMDLEVSLDVRARGTSKGDMLYVRVARITNPDEWLDSDRDLAFDDSDDEEFITTTLLRFQGPAKISKISIQRGGQDALNTGQVDIDNICFKLVDTLNVANHDLQFSETVNFYPNPVNNTLNIELGNPSNDNINIVVRDIWGREIITSSLKKQSTNKTLDFAKYTNGVYIIELTKPNGEKYFEKIIKQ